MKVKLCHIFFFILYEEAKNEISNKRKPNIKLGIGYGKRKKWMARYIYAKYKKGK